jgi:uncharacterized protein YcbK (DUF882 family)
MAGRPTSDPSGDLALLDRILKQQNKTEKARLRIMIAGDPTRPVRSISLPRLLPTVVTAGVILLILATIILARGSWQANGALAKMQGRLHAMVQAADSVALRPGESNLGSVAGGPTLPLTVPARGPSGDLGRFAIQSVNTGEEVEVAVNLTTGEVEGSSYRKLRHLMRCLRTGAETPVDPRLIDLLYRIAQRTGQKLQLVSGFRAPMFSKAALSYHTRGMAADIRIPGMTPLMARDLAVSMNVKGIGYYPVSGFIHVDVRDEQARWIDYGKDSQDGEGAEHGSDPRAEAEPQE